MHISQMYLNLTRKKIGMTRLPHELLLLEERRWDYGTPKAELEPLIDYWAEIYDWRSRETLYNNALPQFRTIIGLRTETVKGSLLGITEVIPDTPLRRLHFAHIRSPSKKAIPLLFCHGWPGSFIEVSKVVDALSDPVSTPPKVQHNDIDFHIVAPNIPGFGFSDPSTEEHFGPKATAAVFDRLMKNLGYTCYVVYGASWGFKVARCLAMDSGSGCVAVYTTSPDLPAPSAWQNLLHWLKYQIARLTDASIPLLSFGYTPSDFAPICDLSGKTQGNALFKNKLYLEHLRSPQTVAYGLCDSPVGLLACMLDTLRVSSTPDVLPDALVTAQGHTSLWKHEEILDCTMLQWLPGPEDGLRWLHQAMREDCWSSYTHVPLGITVFENSCPPMWAAAGQRVVWVKRHQGSTDWPAWEAPSEVAADLRTYCRRLLEWGLLRGLDKAIVNEVD
ncbi:Alpha/Beta hydrolase protein [Cryomyces antarcticus]